VRRFLLEWLSFLCRYVPVGMLEVLPQEMNHRPPSSHLKGRNDLETLFLSPHSEDWVRISEMLLGPVPEGFRFEPKHKTSG
jgi:tRNA-dihydrouridine synthase 3